MTWVYFTYPKYPWWRRLWYWGQRVVGQVPIERKIWNMALGISLAAYTTAIFSGKVGAIHGVRIVESNNPEGP